MLKKFVWLVCCCSIGLFTYTTPSTIPQASPHINTNEPTFNITPLDPQVDMPNSERQHNDSGSQCVFCSLQMCAKHMGIESLYHLTDKYTFATGPEFVKKILDENHVHFIQKTGSNTKQLLIDYVEKQGIPAAIGVDGHHCIVCVHYSPETNEAKIIDNSDKQLRVQTWTMEKFNQHFDGWVVVLLNP